MQHPGAAQRAHQPQRPVLERVLLILIGQAGPGPLVHLGEQPGQVQPGGGRIAQDLIRVLPPARGQLVRPPAQRPRHRFRDLPRRQRRRHPRVRLRPADPHGVRDGRAPGHAGPADQPGPRAVVRVGRVALPGAERAQDRGPRRGQDRAGLLRAAGLLPGRQRGRVGGGGVVQPGAGHGHGHGLSGAGEDRDGSHRGARLPPGSRAGWS